MTIQYFLCINYEYILVILESGQMGEILRSRAQNIQKFKVTET